MYTRSTLRLVLIDPDGHALPDCTKTRLKENAEGLHDTITAPVPPDAVQRRKRLDDIVKEQHTRDRGARSDDSSPWRSQTLPCHSSIRKELNQSLPGTTPGSDLSLPAFLVIAIRQGAENHLDQLTVHAIDNFIPCGIRSLYYLMDENPGTGYNNVPQGLLEKSLRYSLNSLTAMYEYMTGCKGQKAAQHE